MADFQYSLNSNYRIIAFLADSMATNKKYPDKLHKFNIYPPTATASKRCMVGDAGCPLE